MDQANPAAQEALALLVDPVYDKETEKNALNIYNCCRTLNLIYSSVCFESV